MPYKTFPVAINLLEISSTCVMHSYQKLQTVQSYFSLFVALKYSDMKYIGIKFPAY